MLHPSAFVYRPAFALCMALGFGACAYPIPRGPTPLYAMDTTWFNDPIGGVGLWKRTDRRAAMRAASARQDRWEDLRRGSRRASRSTTPGDRSAREMATVASGATSDTRASSRDAARLSWRDKRRKRRSTQLASARSAPNLREQPMARMAPSPSGAARPVHGDGLLLGDGTVAEEMAVAAQRVVGIRDALAGPAFLRHILTAAAVSDPHTEIRDVWSALVRDGRTVRDATEAERGHLAFFRSTHDLDRDGVADEAVTMAAVVELNRGDGTLVCIGEFHGEVQRFTVTPSHPTVHRMRDASGALNVPMRYRSLGDPPSAPLWSGQLLVGIGRVR